MSSSTSAFRNLAEIARDGHGGLAAATLDVQAELFLGQAAQGPVDGTQISAFVLMLLPQLGAGEAEELARRLSPCAATPPAVIAALFARGGRTAEAVLRLSPRLAPEILSAALTDADPRLAAALAERPDLGAGQQILLSDRREAVIRVALARNPAILLSPEVKRRLLTLARQEEALARALLTRSDIALDLLLPLYPFADPEQRQRMLAHLAKEVGAAAPDHAMAALAPPDIVALTELALDGCAALMTGLAQRMPLEPTFTAAALADDSRELLALALVSAGIPAPDATRMLLRTGDEVARDSHRLTALVMLMREVRPDVARALVGRIAGRAAARAEHVPFMAAGGTPSRAGAAARRPWPGQSLRQARGQG